MVRNTSVALVDTVARPLIATAQDYADGTVVTSHSHRRGQLIFGATGALVLTTPQGTWVTPPQRGMWIPPKTPHEVRMVGAVTTESVYVLPDMAVGMPDRCRVVGISPFMRGLIEKALDAPLDYPADSHAGALMALILHEMRLLPELPLSLPFPASPALAEVCRSFLLHPAANDTIDRWADTLGMSRRVFTRQFRRETGMSFVEWRQQACLVSALPRLVGREPVTTVAMDLGYENPAAFTTMFKRVLGASPRAYVQNL